jgi:prenyltransferase beta subunit
MVAGGSMRRAFIVLALIIQCVFITSALAQSTQITNGLSYLAFSQNLDGSWGNDTADVIKTFQLLNYTNNSQYSNSVLWLQNQTFDTTDYLSERIYALSVAGNDISLLITYIDQLAHAWGGHDDYEVNNFDTVFGLQALKAVNYSDQTIIQSAIDYLLSTQNTDGGFGFYPSTCSGCDDGDDSNVYMTAMVSSTLQQFQRTTSIATATNKATSYLIAHQNVDGGFGPSTSSGSTVYETSLAYLALVGETTDATVLGNAINCLSSNQLPND